MKINRTLYKWYNEWYKLNQPDKFQDGTKMNSTYFPDLFK